MKLEPSAPPVASGVDGFLCEGPGNIRQLIRFGKSYLIQERLGGSLILVADGGNAENGSVVTHHSSISPLLRPAD